MLANRAIVRCEGGWAVAALGTWVFTIALALYAYYEHGPVGVGLAVAARMLPAALFAALPAFLERRWSRHTIVLTSALARCLVLEGVALVVWVDAVSEAAGTNAGSRPQIAAPNCSIEVRSAPSAAIGF